MLAGEAKQWHCDSIEEAQDLLDDFRRQAHNRCRGASKLWLDPYFVVIDCMLCLQLLQFSGRLRRARSFEVRAGTSLTLVLVVAVDGPGCVISIEKFGSVLSPCQPHPTAEPTGIP